MTDPVAIKKITSHPKYAELVRRRSRLALLLSVIVLAIYYGFILVISFAPKVLGTPISPGAVATFGFPVGVGVILSAIALTGFYVHKANTVFDKLNRELIEAAK